MIYCSSPTKKGMTCLFGFWRWLQSCLSWHSAHYCRAQKASVRGEMECYSIQNRDSQHYCLAMARANVMECYSIQNRDFQHICIAQVQGNKMECYSIQDRDAQNQCLAMF